MLIIFYEKKYISYNFKSEVATFFNMLYVK